MKKILGFLLALLALIILGFALYLWISDCGVSPFRCGDYPTQNGINIQKIAVGSGPEDMAIDNSLGQPRIIVSCDQRRQGQAKKGGFYAIDLANNQSYELSIAPADFEIYPHGIDIVTIDSITYLYAISHHQDGESWRHPVVRFTIQGNTLVYNDTYENRLMSVPNDLDVLSDGSFYATNYVPNMDEIEQNKAILGIKNGSIVHYDGKGGWKIAADDLCFPNGISVDEPNNLLYVTNGACHEVLQFKLEGGILNTTTKKSTIKHGQKITLGDNLLVDNQGQLWVTAHPCPLDFLAHSTNNDEKAPIQVFAIDPLTLKPTIAFQNNGDLISAASTALVVNNRLYLSQVFDPYVLVVEGIPFH